MEGVVKGCWLIFMLACYMGIVIPVYAYKKPAFCPKEGEPFSFLWHIKKRDPPSYLFGTIHVPYTRVWDHIPDNAKAAFHASASVYFELDLLRPDTVSALAHCQMLPTHSSLDRVLPPDLYARLKRHLDYVRGMMPAWTTTDTKKKSLDYAGTTKDTKMKSLDYVRGMMPTWTTTDSKKKSLDYSGADTKKKSLDYADTFTDTKKKSLYYADSVFRAVAGEWERKRPVWVLLLVQGLTEGEVRWRGVPVLDLFLAQEAERMGKGTDAVETVEEQCLPLNGLNISQVLIALNHTLLQHEQRENDPSTYTADDLIRHYNCGDLDSTLFGQDSALPTFNTSHHLIRDEDEEEEEESVDAYFRRELIYNRNKRMGSRVVELLEKNQGKSLFFAFGAGHFLGNNSVLDFIQEHGYEVEHLSVYAKIPKSKNNKIVDLDNSKTASKLDSAIIRKGHGRRSSRHRNPVAMPSLGLRQRLFESSTLPAPTTQKAKNFNDLWVRLDVNEKKTRNAAINSIEHRGPHQSFQKWYQESHRPNNIAFSAASTLQTSSCCIIALMFSYTSIVHIELFASILIGIT